MWFALVPMANAAAEPISIVAFGDSLTAGYELAPEEAFPVKLEAALRERGYDVRVDNAGVSGDTASAGLARLDWAVPEETRAVILALGANDALRGIDPSVTKSALEEIITTLAGRGAEVLLVGMRAPPNMGADYARAFDELYQDLAERHCLIFYPFFLDGVAANPDLNLADGMHPNAEGVDIMVDGILPSVEDMMARLGEGLAC